MDDAFGHWVAGFIDGEGCFRIHKSKISSGHPYYAAQFSLKVRDDDRPVIEEIVSRTGIGRISAYSRREGNSKPCCLWQVWSQEESLKLVEFLDKYPLRAKKKRDYEIWKQAVLWWTSSKKGHRWTGIRDWSPMVEFHRQLSETRAYPS